MNSLLLLLAGALVGAYVGARYGRWRYLERSGPPVSTASMSDLLGGRQVELIERLQRRRSLALVLGWSLLGALLGTIIIVIVAASIGP